MYALFLACFSRMPLCHLSFRTLPQVVVVVAWSVEVVVGAQNME
jgi:hypothetical protein